MVCKLKYYMYTYVLYPRHKRVIKLFKTQYFMYANNIPWSLINILR